MLSGGKLELTGCAPLCGLQSILAVCTLYTVIYFRPPCSDKSLDILEYLFMCVKELRDNRCLLDYQPQGVSFYVCKGVER